MYNPKNHPLKPLSDAIKHLTGLPPHLRLENHVLTITTSYPNKVTTWICANRGNYLHLKLERINVKSNGMDKVKYIEPTTPDGWWIADEHQDEQIIPAKPPKRKKDKPAK